MYQSNIGAIFVRILLVANLLCYSNVLTPYGLSVLFINVLYLYFILSSLCFVSLNCFKTASLVQDIIFLV